MGQRQDLVIFNDHSVFSKKLLCNGVNTVVVLTSMQATQASWAINVLMESYLFGYPVSLNSEQKSGTLEVDPQAYVTVASMVHGTSWFQSTFNKLQVNSSHYTIVDMLTDFVKMTNGKSADKILKSLADMFPDKPESSLIVLEQPELLLLLVPNLSADMLSSKFINVLRKKCALLVVNTVTDSVQVENDTAPASEFKRFLQTNIFKSNVVLSLSPLPTGRAKDVTGTLRITRGPKSFEGFIPEIHVVENEYLYLTERETTKLFYS
uniref:Elp6 protein n=1 Tax=Nakaseomyces delphensis TaxID=51657 RepID=Q707Z7_NAKDE|nr:Elp6 protein [Nakaseomyces delphensis]